MPELLEKDSTLDSAATALGELFGRQQPAAGIVGGGVKTAVKQFRMPGYPLAMICTDVLSEGEDLHTYCDRVVHYGVAWTPSAMEQRNGRVDRVSSLADRRLAALDRAVEETDKIQIQIPYLKDSVEYLQVHRVLRRLHQFNELMHELGSAGKDDPHVEVDAAEFRRAEAKIPRITEPLRSAFDVRPVDLEGAARAPAVPAALSSEWRTRLPRCARHPTCRTSRTIRCTGTAPQPPSTPRVPWAAIVNNPSRSAWTHEAVTCSCIATRRSPTLQTSSRKASSRSSPHAALGSASLRLRWQQKASAARRYHLALEGDVLLGAPTFDSARARSLIEQLTDTADELEHRLTRGDLTLTDVRQTLNKDHRHER